MDLDTQHKYKAFRNLKRWEISNLRLYNLMKDRNIRPGYIAEKCRVTLRTVQRWLYEGSIPKADKKKIICDILMSTEKELF